MSSIAYLYSHADWDNLHDHLRNVPWGISLNSEFLLLLVNFGIPPLFNGPEVLSSSASDKAKLFAKTFLRTLTLMTLLSLYLSSILELI